jgi:hypothetical protein
VSRVASPPGTKLLRADTNTEITLGELIESDAKNLPVWSLDERFRLTRPCSPTRSRAA